MTDQPTPPRWRVYGVLNGWRLWDSATGKWGPPASLDRGEVEREARERNHAE